MAYFRCGGGGIPSSLKSGMNDVLNKKFGTSTTYPPSDWPSDVNLLGPLPEKTVSGEIASFSDGADDVPISDCKFYFNPKQASGTPSPSNPLQITGWTGLAIYHTDGQTPPVHSETKSVTWTEQGTIYGGYVTKDKVVATHDLQTFDGSESWTLSGTTFFYCSKQKENIKASQTRTASNGIVLKYSTNGQIRVYISENTGYVDTSTNMNTLMANGINFAYALATPIEYDITALNLSTYYGDNNFWSEGDTASVDYRADIALALGQ